MSYILPLNETDDLSDDDYLDIASMFSKMSHHPFYNDGACIVSPEGHIVATGWTTDTEPHEPAIMAAMLNTTDDLAGCTLYVTRFYPSDIVLEAIRDEGIKRVVSYASPIDPDPVFIRYVRDFLYSNGIRWSRVHRLIINFDDLS